jgi:hypothetical protein
VYQFRAGGRAWTCGVSTYPQRHSSNANRGSCLAAVIPRQCPCGSAHAAVPMRQGPCGRAHAAGLARQCPAAVPRRPCSAARPFAQQRGSDTRRPTPQIDPDTMATEWPVPRHRTCRRRRVLWVRECRPGSRSAAPNWAQLRSARADEYKYMKGRDLCEPPGGLAAKSYAHGRVCCVPREMSAVGPNQPMRAARLVLD